jgi:hypothetical protein
MTDEELALLTQAVELAKTLQKEVEQLRAENLRLHLGIRLLGYRRDRRRSGRPRKEDWIGDGCALREFEALKERMQLEVGRFVSDEDVLIGLQRARALRTNSPFNANGAKARAERKTMRNKISAARTRLRKSQ